MEENTPKRIRRTTQQMAEAIDEKIAAQQQKIDKIEEKRAEAMEGFDAQVAAVKTKIKELEVKKQAILAPKPRRKTKKERMQEILKAVEKSGMKPEEIAEKLGLTQPE